MKWSHANLGHVQSSVRKYIYDHSLQLSIACAIAAAALIAYGIAASSSSNASQHALSSGSTQLTLNEESVIEIADETTGETIDTVQESNITVNSSNQTTPAVTGSVRVNDTTVPIPASGHVHKHIVSNDGTTSLDMSVSSNTSQSDSSRQQTTMNISVQSSTDSETNYDSEGS